MEEVLVSRSLHGTLKDVDKPENFYIAAEILFYNIASANRYTGNIDLIQGFDKQNGKKCLFIELVS